MQALFTACRSGQFDMADKEVKNAIAEGYPASQMLNQVRLILDSAVRLFLVPLPLNADAFVFSVVRYSSRIR